MLPALERAIFERTGERVPRDAWDLRALPAYLSSRSASSTSTTRCSPRAAISPSSSARSASARSELWAAAPRERYERTGLTRGTSTRCRRSVTLDVGGRSSLAYPGARRRRARASTSACSSPPRGRRRRDRATACAGCSCSSSAGSRSSRPSCPAPLRAGARARASSCCARSTRRSGSTQPAARQGRVHRAPREGRARCPAQLAQLGRLAVELVRRARQGARRAEAARRQARRHARRARRRRRASSRHLVPPDLMAHASPVARLEHILRYLQGDPVRLQRQAHDPQKDQQKAAQVVPLWQSFVAPRASCARRAARRRARRLRLAARGAARPGLRARAQDRGADLARARAGSLGIARRGALASKRPRKPLGPDERPVLAHCADVRGFCALLVGGGAIRLE